MQIRAARPVVSACASVSLVPGTLRTRCPRLSVVMLVSRRPAFAKVVPLSIRPDDEFDHDYGVQDHGFS